MKNTNIDIWVVGTSNCLFSRGSKTGTNFPKKIKQLLANLHSLWQVHFVVAILFVLALASERAVLNGNDVFSILVVSTKNRYSSFLKKVFVFQKICLKVKVLKTFETLIDCHIKTCRSLTRRAILKISRYHSVGFKMKTLRKSVFEC